jgi:endonuclease-3
LQPGDPLHGLIATVLSQHTSDVNSDRAFGSLLTRFGDLENVRVAPIEEIEAAIRSGGLGRVKAARIKRILEQIKQTRGQLTLDFLRDLELGEARRHLTQLDGVGPKTAACVLLFDCGLPAIPVDTHVHRVSRRLGLVGPRATAERAHEELEAIVPPTEAYTFHVNLIRHGRQTCKALRPHCQACPVADLCPKVGVALKAAAASVSKQVSGANMTARRRQAAVS